MAKKKSTATAGLMTAIFTADCIKAGLPAPIPEYQFCPGRKWRADYAFPDHGIIVEVEGAVYGTGRPCPTCKRRRPGGHSSVTGILRDIQKYNKCAEMGIFVFRALPQDIENGTMIPMLVQAFANARKVAENPAKTAETSVQLAA